MGDELLGVWWNGLRHATTSRRVRLTRRRHRYVVEAEVGTDDRRDLEPQQFLTEALAREYAAWLMQARPSDPPGTDWRELTKSRSAQAPGFSRGVSTSETVAC